MPSGYDAEARAHQSDAVEIGLFARAFFRALARLVAFVQELDLLELLESLREQALGIFELNAQFVGLQSAPAGVPALACCANMTLGIRVRRLCLARLISTISLRLGLGPRWWKA